LWNAFTLRLSFKVAATVSSPATLFQALDESNLLGLRVVLSGGSLRVDTGPGETLVAGEGQLADGNWHDVLLSFARRRDSEAEPFSYHAVISVDDSPIQSSETVAPEHAARAAVVSVGPAFVGDIKDVVVWETALSAQRAGEYRAGRLDLLTFETHAGKQQVLLSSDPADPNYNHLLVADVRPHGATWGAALADDTGEAGFTLVLWFLVPSAALGALGASGGGTIVDFFEPGEPGAAGPAASTRVALSGSAALFLEATAAVGAALQPADIIHESLSFADDQWHMLVIESRGQMFEDNPVVQPSHGSMLLAR
jgi:Laminin G domain.